MMKLLTTMMFGMLTVCGSAMAQPYYSGVYGNFPHCQACHSTLNQFGPWLSTPHAFAYDSLPAAAKSNPVCLPCHTTGWDLSLNNGGFDDYFYTGDSLGMTQMRNVQCETCHGPTDQVPHPASTVVDMHAEVCGDCHTGMGRPTYDHWLQGGHSTVAVQGAQNLTCAKCHEARSAAKYLRTHSLPTSLPTNPVWQTTCAVCHAIHEQNVYNWQLVLPADSTCRTCHTKDGAVVGQIPHSPQAEMLLGPGFGGYEYPGYTYNNSCHQTYVPQACVLCHMYSHDLGNPDTTATGHAMTPSIQVCVVCHNGQIPPDSSFNIMGAQTMTDSLLGELAEMLEHSDSTTLEYQRAKFNYDFVNNDRSRGVHNFMYAEDLLMASMDHLMPLNVTMTPLNPPIVVPANGGSFQFNASVQRNLAPPAAFWVWARDRYPDGTYTGNLLGPVQINPPVGVTVTRQRTQVVPSGWPAGAHYYLGYAHTSVSYPATCTDSFAWTKSTAGDGGATVWEAANYGELFPGEEASSHQLTAFGLIGAWPNPFNPTTDIRYKMQDARQVSLEVYDTAGRLVVTLVDGWREPGEYSVTFDGSKLSAGVYIYRLTAGERTASGKMALVK